MKKATEKWIFECAICGERFKTKEDLIKDMIEWHAREIIEEQWEKYGEEIYSDEEWKAKKEKQAIDEAIDREIERSKELKKEVFGGD